MLTNDELIEKLTPNMEAAAQDAVTYLRRMLGGPVAHQCSPELDHFAHVLVGAFAELLRDANSLHQEELLRASEHSTRMVWSGLIAGQMVGLRDAGADLDPEKLEQAKEAVHRLATGGVTGSGRGLDGNLHTDTLLGLVALSQVQVRHAAEE